MIFYGIGSITGIAQHAALVACSKDINSGQTCKIDRQMQISTSAFRFLRVAATCTVKNTNDLVRPVARIAHFISLRARTIALCHRRLSRFEKRDGTFNVQDMFIARIYYPPYFGSDFALILRSTAICRSFTIAILGLSGPPLLLSRTWVFVEPEHVGRPVALPMHQPLPTYCDWSTSIVRSRTNCIPQNSQNKLGARNGMWIAL